MFKSSSCWGNRSAEQWGTDWIQLCFLITTPSFKKHNNDWLLHLKWFRRGNCNQHYHTHTHTHTIIITGQQHHLLIVHSVTWFCQELEDNSLISKQRKKEDGKNEIERGREATGAISLTGFCGFPCDVCPGRRVFTAHRVHFTSERQGADWKTPQSSGEGDDRLLHGLLSNSCRDIINLHGLTDYYLIKPWS